MTNVCSICNHARRLEIDRQIVEGKSYSFIARHFGASADAVSRHASLHLSRQLVQSFAQRQAVENMNLLGRIDKILSRAEKIFKRNYLAKHDGMALKALAESRCTIELLARIAAYLHEARANELQAQSNSYEAHLEEKQQEYIQRAFDRLTEEETDLFVKLLDKVEAEDFDEPIVTHRRTKPPKGAASLAYSSR